MDEGYEKALRDEMFLREARRQRRFIDKVKGFLRKHFVPKQLPKLSELLEKFREAVDISALSVSPTYDEVAAFSNKCTAALEDMARAREAVEQEGLVDVGEREREVFELNNLIWHTRELVNLLNKSFKTGVLDSEEGRVRVSEMLHDGYSPAEITEQAVKETVGDILGPLDLDETIGRLVGRLPEPAALAENLEEAETQEEEIADELGSLEDSLLRNVGPEVDVAGLEDAEEKLRDIEDLIASHIDPRGFPRDLLENYVEDMHEAEKLYSLVAQRLEQAGVEEGEEVEAVPAESEEDLEEATVDEEGAEVLDEEPAVGEGGGELTDFASGGGKDFFPTLEGGEEDEEDG